MRKRPSCLEQLAYCERSIMHHSPEQVLLLRNTSKAQKEKNNKNVSESLCLCLRDRNHCTAAACSTLSGSRWQSFYSVLPQPPIKRCYSIKCQRKKKRGKWSNLCLRFDRTWNNWIPLRLITRVACQPKDGSNCPSLFMRKLWKYCFLSLQLFMRCDD